MGDHADAAQARRAATRIVKVLREAGHTAYFAGGCVRDELLGLEPTDYDVATDATPVRIRALFPRTADVGANFGVMLVREDRRTIEVATFRAEGPYSDRRRPDHVTFSDAKSDAQRRDYTINALFLDPLADSKGPAHGRVIDFVGGLEDLRAHLLRAVGNPEERLAEDHLRALRAVRLTARLGLHIHPDTARAISRHAAGLHGVSRERIGDELRKILIHPSRAAGIALLDSLLLTGEVLREPAEQRDARVLTGLPSDASFACALAGWAVDRGHSANIHGPEGVVARWRAALCLSNEESDALGGILEGVQTILHRWDRLGVAQRKRLAAGKWFREAMAIVKSIDSGVEYRISEAVSALTHDGIGVSPVMLVTGDDLVAAGMIPGPAFRRILESVYDAQLEGRVRSRAEALELARELSV